MNAFPKLQTTTRIALALAMVASAIGSYAQEWGSLTGRLVVDGSVGKPAAINVSQDIEYCGQKNLVAENVVVGEKDGLTNAFVFLYLKRGKSVDVHPDLQETPEAAVLDNQGCRFEPHALLLQTGQELKVTSTDPIGHNTKLDLLKNVSFNQSVNSVTPLSKKFDKSEPIPLAAACSIHPWMKSYVLIRDNPYMAVTGKDGSFEIKNIPAGANEFIFWHESVGNLKNLSLGSAGKTDRKGRAKLKITAGETLKLGDVIIKASDLGK
jgi:hypothetical protein